MPIVAVWFSIRRAHKTGPKTSCRFCGAVSMFAAACTSVFEANIPSPCLPLVANLVFKSSEVARKFINNQGLALTGLLANPCHRFALKYQLDSGNWKTTILAALPPSCRILSSYCTKTPFTRACRLSGFCFLKFDEGVEIWAWFLVLWLLVP